MENKKLISTIVGIIILIILGIASALFSDQTMEVNNVTPPISNILENVNTENLRIYFFNVGNADCTLIVNKKEAMLIDGANQADAELLYNYIKNDLKYYDLKYVIATHSDSDHIGGLDSIVENMKSVDVIFMPNTDNKSKDVENLIKVANSKNISIEAPEINSTYTIRRCKF